MAPEMFLTVTYIKHSIIVISMQMWYAAQTLQKFAIWSLLTAQALSTVQGWQKCLRAFYVKAFEDDSGFQYSQADDGPSWQLFVSTLKVGKEQRWE